ncbi:hypothetical protein HELRODRAFT_165491 [Helobdella robusta]|uniref:SAP domain-containing protein n=1 Tax=Helobdella robusta TaxID=6412 RepID=T1EWW6_HELRO|nr:hypothetical protein HELRODRAFT_165491 [Helobdella robusta]ESN91455.1 hypothetical protein HELRODRAFT_165491 [Helobdella robusta]
MEVLFAGIRISFAFPGSSSFKLSSLESCFQSNCAEYLSSNKCLKNYNIGVRSKIFERWKFVSMSAQEKLNTTNLMKKLQKRNLCSKRAKAVLINRLRVARINKGNKPDEFDFLYFMEELKQQYANVVKTEHHCTSSSIYSSEHSPGSKGIVNICSGFKLINQTAV